MDKFWDRVQKTDGCWLWIGPKDYKGYGIYCIGGKQYKAHRYSYEITHSLIILRCFFCCHKCDNPSCVNPDHLFIGSPKDNTQDMIAKGRSPSRGISYCNNGHDLTLENSFTRIGKNKRTCRLCKCETNRRYRLKKALRPLTT